MSTPADRALPFQYQIRADTRSVDPKDPKTAHDSEHRDRQLEEYLAHPKAGGGKAIGCLLINVATVVGPEAGGYLVMDNTPGNFIDPSGMWDGVSTITIPVDAWVSSSAYSSLGLNAGVTVLGDNIQLAILPSITGGAIGHMVLPAGMSNATPIVGLTGNLAPSVAASFFAPAGTTIGLALSNTTTGTRYNAVWSTYYVAA